MDIETEYAHGAQLWRKQQRAHARYDLSNGNNQTQDRLWRAHIRAFREYETWFNTMRQAGLVSNDIIMGINRHGA